MIAKFFLSGLFAFVLYESSLAQASFQKTLGLEKTDDVYSIVTTPDGGYIIASNYTPTLDARKVRLVKTDANGNEQWTKIIGETHENNCRTIQPTKDGGYIIGGWLSTITNTGLLLLKTDASGNQQWWKMFNPKGEKAYGYSAQQTADGGYIICGSVSSNGQDAYLVKTDASGNLVWEKTFGGANEDVAYTVFQTADGGYILGGQTKSFGDTDGDAYLLKVSADGTKEWQKTFDGPSTYQDYLHCVQQTSDGGFIATGNISNRVNDIYLLKTDFNGKKLWSKNFGTKDSDQGRWVEQTSDGGYIVCGFVTTTHQSVSDRNLYVIKTDAQGNEQWHREYGESGTNYGRCVRQTPDGGFIILGDTNDKHPYRREILLIKTDANGN